MVTPLFIVTSQSERRSHVFHKVLSRSVPVTQSILVVGWHLVCHFTIFTLVPFTNGPSMVEVLIESCLELIKTKMCDSVAHFYYMYIRLPQIVETTVANRDGGFILCQVLSNVRYNHYQHNGYVAF